MLSADAAHPIASEEAADPLSRRVYLCPGEQYVCCLQRVGVVGHVSGVHKGHCNDTHCDQLLVAAK